MVVDVYTQAVHHFLCCLVVDSHIHDMIELSVCWSVAGRQSHNSESTFICKVSGVRAIYTNKISTACSTIDPFVVDQLKYQVFCQRQS